MKVSTTILISLAVLTLLANNASADTFRPAEIRVSEGVKKFNDTRQFAVAFELPSGQRLRSSHLELAVGSIFDADKKRAFVSLGPVWHLPIKGESLYARIGFSPTLVGGSTFENRDIGGNLHFTSSVSIGAAFGRSDSFSLMLRAQHTSNGGLHGTNPGLDMVGLSFSYNFDSQ